MKPTIGITMGDPTGIGPELLLKTFSNTRIHRRANFVVYGDASYLVRLSQFFNKKGFHWPLRATVKDMGTLKHRSLEFGKVESWAGQASALYIEQAVSDIQKNYIDAMVTLPINKESFATSRLGRKFTDHTQALAGLSKTTSVALMLVAGPLRAVHVTQHVPLKKVAKLITKSRVSETIRLALAGLTQMGIKHPRLAVCGLNPHAGDGGTLGREEIAVISPVIQSFKKKKYLVEGPISADAVWTRVEKGEFDAAVAMYHDQGQIPIKMTKHPVVNVSLGLPFVRTSVGHGTAFDKAGKGVASNASFLQAIETAMEMAQKQKRKHG